MDGILPEKQSAKFEGSYAYKTMNERVPRILTHTIDGMSRSYGQVVSVHGDIAGEEVKSAIGALAKLRYEILTNKPLKDLKVSGSIDFDIWRMWLQSFQDNSDGGNITATGNCKASQGLKTYNSPWLEVESYVYRLIYDAIDAQPTIREFYDTFSISKWESLENSENMVDNLGEWYDVVLATDAGVESRAATFKQLIKLSLWSNRGDMSHSGGEVVSSNQKSLSILDELAVLDEFLLVDRSTDVWTLFEKWPGSEQLRFDIVLDNAGFELVSDLAMVDWFFKIFPRLKVVLHAKRMPWFVSDTTPNDFSKTMTWLEGRSSTKHFASRLMSFLKSGQLVLESHLFWTTPYSFWSMEKISPDLFTDLQSSNFILFKGDLNGRKLFDDRMWPPCTPFQQAVSPFTSLFSKTIICLTRTLKCDVAFGLKDKLDLVNKLDKKDPDWKNNGKYGEIQAVLPK